MNDSPILTRPGAIAAPSLLAVEPAAGLPHGITRADFYTGRYRLFADAVTGDRRLFDVLRDTTRQHLDLRHVSVITHDGVEPIAEYEHSLLKKADLEWVAVREEAPRTESRLYSFVHKTPVRVALVLAACRIEGNVHLETKASGLTGFFLRGIEQSTERFVALTDATVTPTPAGTHGPIALAIVNLRGVLMYSGLE